jgi:hypothetical protein
MFWNGLYRYNKWFRNRPNLPSKASQHIAFFIVLLVSAGLHWYVYTNLRRVLLRDYPKLGKRLAKIALWVFILLDMPFFFIYFRGFIHAAMTMLSRVLLYPFLVWQTIMLMWVIILFPITLFRWLKKIGSNLRATLHRRQDNQDEKQDIKLKVVPE